MMVLPYCEPNQVLLQIGVPSLSLYSTGRINHYYRSIILTNDLLWRDECLTVSDSSCRESQIGFREKIFKEVSWLSNYRYYTLHVLPTTA